MNILQKSASNRLPQHPYTLVTRGQKAQRLNPRDLLFDILNPHMKGDILLPKIPNLATVQPKITLNRVDRDCCVNLSNIIIFQGFSLLS